MFTSSRHIVQRRIFLFFTALVFALTACSSEDDHDDLDTGVTDVGDEDAAPDVEVIEDVQPDTDDEDAGDTGDTTHDVGEDPGDHVELDLEPYMEGAPDPDGSVQVYEITDESDLIEGGSATSRVGDYVLENDRVRFVVEQDNRNMNPCPWGGNIIDAEYRSQEYGGDILGEICLFLNADQTFKPETYEVIHDGSEGAAVLAVSGRTEILDYLNVEGMIAQLGASAADLFVLKPDELLPLAITKYYVLRPGDLGVRTLTMLRNDGDETLHLVASHLLVSGADGAYFNPLSSMGGFGYEGRGLMNTNPDRLPFLALLAEQSAMAYMPRPDDRIDADLPVSGSYLTIFNVAASVLGRTDIIGTLLATEGQISNMEGILHIEPGEMDMIEHWTYVGDGDLSTMIDVMYAELGAETGAVEGVVVDADAAPVPGARVTAVNGDGRTMNQTISDESGAYHMRVPPGSYELPARLDRDVTVSPPTESVTADETTSADDLVLQSAGTISVSVRSPDETPVPARVTVICDGVCPHKSTPNEEDVTTDGLPEQWATVEWVGVTGDLAFSVPEGEYRVVVSRGLEWSIWPEGFADTGGAFVDVAAGETVDLDAEIARVVDTSGALSGDFHVHTISSLDSTTPKEDRVLTFLTEGVDVIVSTDHDVIADYGPAVEALDAEEHMVSLIGNEITTIDLGHYNGFPLTIDESHRRGGAMDWAGGADLAVPPSDIFDWIREYPGEQVVQINHPDSSYMSFSDVLRGISYGDTSRMRVRTPDYDPETGDTGLWSDDFSAMELMNGDNMERFYGVARWWLTLIGRGHSATGTAVTDTHTRYGRSLGAVPRTFVYVDDDKDSATDFDTGHFVESVNAQRAIGTNGPFVRVEASNDAGDTVGLGDVLETGGEAVNFELTIEVPEWIDVDRIEMIMNDVDVVTDPGEYNTEPIEPTESFEVELSEEHLEVVAAGAGEHRRYRTTIPIEVEAEEDAYVIFFIRGSSGMYPVLPDDDIEPFAFTNPIYLDTDGNGYSNPPLAELAGSDPPEPHPTMLKGPVDADLEHGHQLSREEILERLEHLEPLHQH